MRACACLLVCAALALAPRRATAAHPPGDERLERIKSQILAKLGLTSRPTPQGAPPHDVVRQILARAADPAPREEHHDEHAMREIIAIAHRGEDLTSRSRSSSKDHERWKSRRRRSCGSTAEVNTRAREFSRGQSTMTLGLECINK